MQHARMSILKQWPAVKYFTDSKNVFLDQQCFALRDARSLGIQSIFCFQQFCLIMNSGYGFYVYSVKCVVMLGKVCQMGRTLPWGENSIKIIFFKPTLKVNSFLYLLFVPFLA